MNNEKKNQKSDTTQMGYDTLLCPVFFIQQKISFNKMELYKVIDTGMGDYEVLTTVIDKLHAKIEAKEDGGQFISTPNLNNYQTCCKINEETYNETLLKYSA